MCLENKIDIRIFLDKEEKKRNERVSLRETQRSLDREAYVNVLEGFIRLPG